MSCMKCLQPDFFDVFRPRGTEYWKLPMAPGKDGWRRKDTSQSSTDGSEKLKPQKKSSSSSSVSSSSIGVKVGTSPKKIGPFEKPEEVIAYFEQFGMTQIGTIPLRVLRNTLTTRGDALTTAEFDEICHLQGIQHHNQDQEIDVQQFIRWICNP